MIDAPGAGVSAPQIGVSLRVFTYRVDDEPGHLINPISTFLMSNRPVTRDASHFPIWPSRLCARCEWWPRG